MDTPEWRDEDWLMRGLKYLDVKDNPVVQTRRKELFQIPAEFSKFLPHPKLSLQTLLKKVRGTIIGSAVGKKAEEFFSAERPNATLEETLEFRVIPPKIYLEEMDWEFGQLWFDGKANSIVDWTHRSKRYPVSAYTVFWELNRACAMRAEWTRASQWMNSKVSGDTLPAVQAACNLMHAYEWDRDPGVRDNRMPTNELLSMLGNNWLSDEHIDSLMRALTSRYETENGLGDVIFAPCVFQHWLRQHHSGLMPVGLRKHEDMLRTGMKRVVYFIAHVNHNHWVAWKVDFTSRAFGHADSMDLPEDDMRSIREQLANWTREIDPEHGELTYKPQIIARGAQSGDTISCGIIAYNAIACDVFRDGLWTRDRSKRFRIEAFNEIVKEQIELKLCADFQSDESRISAHIPYNRGESEREVNDPNERIESSSSPVGINAHEQASCCQSSDAFCREPANKSPERVQKMDKSHSVPGFMYASSSDFGGSEISEASSQARVVTDSHFETEYDTIQDTLTESSGPASRAASPPPRSESSRTSSCPALIDDGLQEKDMKNDEEDRSTSVPTKRTRKQDEGEKQASKRLKTKKSVDLFTFWGVKPKPGRDEDGGNESEEAEQKDQGGGNSRPNWSSSDHDRDSRVGHSRSAAAERKQRATITAGTFEVNDAYFSKYRDQILAVDRHARFKPTQKLVQHSECGKWLTMKSAYSPLYFFKHLETCEGGQYDAILKFFSKTLPDGTSDTVQNSERVYEERACKGITADLEWRVTRYLARPGALGGGGRSVVYLAYQRFGRTFRELSKDQKVEIRQMNEAGWRWVLKPDYGSIQSTSCIGLISVSITGHSGDPWRLTCYKCKALRHNKDLRRALNVPEPLEQNEKFANKMYRPDLLIQKLDKCRGLKKLLHSTDDTTLLFLNYAKGVANGDYRDNLVFTGLVYNIVRKRNREIRGKKMTNFKHDPEFDEFVQTVAILCPRAHRLLSEFFVVRTARSISAKRQKERQFTPGISDRSFELVDEFITKLDIPLRFGALSADDTKLVPSFRPFLDRETNEWFIVGGLGEPLRVVAPEALREELDQADLVQATKLRIWAFAVPLPRIPPIVVAALAIDDHTTAATLMEYTKQILDGLRKRKIWITSYACDGTGKERRNQDDLKSDADGFDTHQIPAPEAGADILDISVAIYGGTPMAFIQDSCHAKKTFRNNIGSGATTIVLGNHPVMYSQTREMAHDAESPIYMRDVEKPDKQDDRAAERMFSSDSLGWFVRNRPSYLGIIVYLFVFGEFIDAFQNRTISLADRVRMVLRTYYFINIWKRFLSAALYPIKKTCISTEALDISSKLIHGFFELFYIYRDHMHGMRIPLLLWLHSSEICEHVFAECRKIVTDFDFASFLHMMPKVHWMVRYSMGLKIEEAKARAKGYAHKWMDNEGLDLTALAMYPSDDDLLSISKIAYSDATDLWRRLGVFMADVQLDTLPLPLTAIDSDEPNDEDEEGNVHADAPDFPPVSSWGPEFETALQYLQYNSAGDEGRPLPTIWDSERAVLERLLALEEHEEENGPIRLDSVEKTMLNVTCAKLALDLDTSLRIEDLEVPNAEQKENFFDQLRRAVGNTIADCLPPIAQSRSESSPDVHADNFLSLDHLVELRRAHDTNLARKAVRTATSRAENEDLLARRQLVKIISDTLNEQDVVRPSTGLNRITRWNGSGHAAGGNAANAAAAAATRAAQALATRSKLYSRHPFPKTLRQLVSDAGIRPSSPLKEGSLGIVFSYGHLFVAQVISIYKKTSEKHAWISEATTIGEISYVAVQAYEQSRGRLFSTTHAAFPGRIRGALFAHIPPIQFIAKLPGSDQAKKGNDFIELSKPSFDIWNGLCQSKGMFPKLLAESRKRKKGKDKTEVEENEGEE